MESLQVYYIVVALVVFFILTCIHGMILKHFIREGVKEALEETGLSKRKTDTTW